MMDRWHRLALTGMAVLLLVPIVMQGRTGTRLRKGDGAALLRSGSDMVRVRFTGNVYHPGIYEFPVGTTVVTAIKLTVAGWPDGKSNPFLRSDVLKGGEIIDVTGTNSQHPGITIKNMGAREKMLLGIRMDPNKMDTNDWEALPGIGPALARSIVSYRQIYGDYESLDSVKLVPGVGENIINRIRPYF